MSAPKRYEPNSSTFVVMLCRDHGEYVLYSDYAALAAENERLRQHLEFFRGKFDAKSNKLLARILKDTNKFAVKEGRDAK